MNPGWHTPPLESFKIGYVKRLEISYLEGNLGLGSEINLRVEILFSCTEAIRKYATRKGNNYNETCSEF
jgi:hypothetical protein